MLNSPLAALARPEPIDQHGGNAWADGAESLV